MITYIQFSLIFFVIHFICYIIAGVIDFRLAKKMYSGKDRLYKSFFRNMDDQKESLRIAKLLIPSQFVRAILMSIVLYPILPFLNELSFLMQFLFMAGIMFIYADFASAIPFSNTIEGIVYLKREFVEKKFFGQFNWRQLCIVPYSDYYLLYFCFNAKQRRKRRTVHTLQNSSE